MCTYDYTPYTGCADGQQHYYIQWVKCAVAVENGRYCSLDTSTKEEQLRKLSSNVLSCPLHGPIAVQQFVLDSANARQLDDEVEKPRARSTARQATTPRGRTPKRGGPDREPEQPVRREIRKQRSRREMAPESSDSESGSLSPRTTSAGRGKRLSDRELAERRSRMSRTASHRRSISADIPQPPLPPLSMRHGRSEVSLPLKSESDEPSATAPQQTRPKNSLDIPRAIGVYGLPSSPDMHRRGSVHRSRSEGLLRQGDAQADPLPTPRSAQSPSHDSSPDQNSELPFSSPGRRGRRTVARSIRDRSVDTTMRRIDEHVASGESSHTATTARDTSTPETLTSTTTSPEPPYATETSHHTRSNSNSTSNPKPRLNTLQIPKPQPHQRDAYSAPTATPPETDITGASSNPYPHQYHQKSRAKSLRNLKLSSPLSSPPLSPLHPPGGGGGSSLRDNNNNNNNNADETASLRSARSSRSRRFEDQVADGRKWVAAREREREREQMPEPNLALVGRGSVDSGYLSGHGLGHQQGQRSWETVASKSSVDLSGGGKVGSGGGSGSGGGRRTLQKAMPASQLQAQGQAQGQGVGLGLGTVQDGQQQQRFPKPAPLNLNMGAGNGLPPCALPVSLFSPGMQPDTEVIVSPGSAKGGRGTLLQRMGLKRKISGMLWDRNGQREVGVEG